jgi:DNA-binding beta-propeller fold protein YncE
VFALGADLAPEGELAGIGGALGVAFSPGGALCVGSAARGSVRCRGPGVEEVELGAGTLRLPNDLAFDRAGRLYVADSAADRVQVFGRDGALVRTIGPGPAPAGLAFPAAVAVAYSHAHPRGELYVGDQRNGRVAVFDLGGRFRRALGAPAAAFSGAWQGRFSRIQGLAVDGDGRVHVLDASQKQVQVLDPETGAFLEAYPATAAAGGRSLPLGLAILRDGRVVVANAEGGRVEVVRTLARGPGGVP